MGRKDQRSDQAAGVEGPGMAGQRGDRVDHVPWRVRCRKVERGAMGGSGLTWTQGRGPKVLHPGSPGAWAGASAGADTLAMY